MCNSFWYYSSLHIHITLHGLFSSVLYNVLEIHWPSDVFRMCASAERQVALHGLPPHNKLLYCTVALHVEMQNLVQWCTVCHEWMPRTHIRFFIIILLTNRGFHNLGERLWEFCHQHGIPFLASYCISTRKPSRNGRVRAPCLPYSRTWAKAYGCYI